MNAATFLAFCKTVKSKDPTMYGFDNYNTFNEVGYYYLYDKKQVDDAIAIFEYNVALFPTSGTIVDSLAEGYLKKGDKKKALYYYKRSIELGYMDNSGAKKVIEELEK